jgi:pyruvate/oxaloacetate carboxyltransferase
LVYAKWKSAEEKATGYLMTVYDTQKELSSLRNEVERLKADLVSIRDAAIVRSPNQTPTVEDYKAVWGICVKIATRALSDTNGEGKV